MSIDARIKRLFPALVIALVAAGAYLQALGLTHLLAAHLGGIVSPPPGSFPKRSLPEAPRMDRVVDGNAILARNPFDSITGPLNARESAGDPTESPIENQANPYADPICESVRVLLITTADDPTWSFAAIALGNDRASLRRIGDEVGGRVVHAMIWDRVWMVKDGRRCQLPLGRSVAGASINGDKPNTSEIPGGRPPNRLPMGIADKITRITDTRFDVDRSIIDMVMENQRELVGSLRVLPAKDGDGGGMKLMGIRRGSLLNSLGLVNGDQLRSINGFEMNDPMVAIQAYSRLLAADKLDVRIIRGGQPVTIDIRLR
ncbi:MAG TPA: type II secretion system protein GspC [Polyangium sp.]|nr:type II secretion system protein GspC [Polyangium sp.]